MCYISIHAIEFAPIGAKWHYSKSDAWINPFSQRVTFSTMESIKDSIIEGKNCRILEFTSQASPGDHCGLHIMYQQNDSIYEYWSGKFHLMYDFGAVKGDSIMTGYGEYMIILKNSTININGHILRTQEVSCGNGVSVTFGGSIIESIGNTYLFFPTVDLEYEGPLRCYQDSNIGTYISTAWSESDCEKIINAIPVNFQPEVTVTYNSTNSTFRVTGIQSLCSFELLDIQGRIIKRGEILNNENILLKNTVRGVFFVKLSNKETKVVRKLIIN